MTTPSDDPYRRCLKIEDWPSMDQEAWKNAIKSGDLFDEQGLASHWSPATRHKNRKGWGRFVNFLQTQHPELLDQLPAVRVTRDNLREYLKLLEAQNLAPYTIVNRIAELSAVISKFALDEDWTWLFNLVSRLSLQARPNTDKRSKLVPTGELYQFGIQHMVAAEQAAGSASLLKAVQYRDGFMIAFLAARPIRRSNLVSIRIDHHLVRNGDGWNLNFEAQEIKNRRPLELSFPNGLVPYLEQYLSRWRPILLQDQQTDRLWVTRYGKPLGDDLAYVRITKVTERAFGKKINPHLFRDCAATTIAIEDPDHVRIGATILGHANLKTTERHYNHATSLEAGRQFQDSLIALRREMRETDKHDK